MSHCSFGFPPGSVGARAGEGEPISAERPEHSPFSSAARRPEEEAGSAGSAGHAGSRGSPGFSRPARATHCELSDESVTILPYRWGWGS